ncbi:hydroxyacid dehydrogenase, partial [bacterium]|nr:hydroxyacid dehydrogenase [bacterium]
LKLIKDGHLGGAALDVYDTEEELAISLRHGKTSQNRQVLAAKALFKYPNVILTPHNAFNTREAVKRKTDQSVQQIVNFMEKGHFLWPVPD